ncbi:Indoleamine 2,3-dioxygenase [Fusarium oxysporum f. sp. albedinis]|nr:Indoleamine 2,3-dioxygenase [Fusarium oxysporum f. sp. albedinis]
MTVTLQRLFTHETKDVSSVLVGTHTHTLTHSLSGHMRCLQSRIDTRRPQPPSRASPTNKSERQRVAFLSSIRLYVIALLNKFSRLQLHARGRKEHGMTSLPYMEEYYEAVAFCRNSRGITPYHLVHHEAVGDPKSLFVNSNEEDSSVFVKTQFDKLYM